MSNRLDQEREQLLQPQRMASCSEKLQSLGYDVWSNGTDMLEFTFKGNIIKFYPYSGWFTGKGVGSDRGFSNLLKRLDGSDKQ